jgi:hypothetical protein
MKTQLSNIGIVVLFLSTGLLAGCGGESVASHVVAPAASGPVAAAAAVETATDAPQPAAPTPAVEPAASEPPKPAEPAAQSDAPKPPVARQRLPADRQPRRPGDAEKITFEDLNLGMQADVAFRPFMLTDRVKELDGQRVSISGFIHGGQSSETIKKFVLLKNLECKFGAGGQADHLGMVYLKEGKTTRFSPDPVKVEGKLKVSPFTGTDGNTWSVYDIEEAEVVK